MPDTAKQVNSKCKLCRRAGEKLFLKGDRCNSPKCAVVRKPYAPGPHGPKGGRKSNSEFSKQLNEKQKLRRTYGISEEQFRNHLKDAKKQQGVFGDNLINRLEMRLDNLVYRMGLAESRAQARQLVGHKMFIVNGKRLNIPSAKLDVGSEIELKEQKVEKNYFKNLKMILKKNNRTPEWISFDPETMKGKILSKPNIDQVANGIDVASVIEFYSRS